MNILIEWENKYSLNIKEIDQQHKKLFDIINILYDSVVCKKSEYVIDQTISDLKEYSLVHFKTEEKYVAKLSPEEEQEHLEEHKNFTLKIDGFRKDYLKSTSILSLEVMYFLKNWLNDHILVKDKMYVELYNKQN